jgi:hypothetical protein
VSERRREAELGEEGGAEGGDLRDGAVLDVLRVELECPELGVAGAPERSAAVMSISGVPCTSPRLTRLRETSMPPALAVTACACASTADSSRASRTATSELIGLG